MEIVKRAIRLMHEGKCIYDQFQLDEDYNVPDAKEDVGNVIEGTVCVKTEDMKLVENYLDHTEDEFSITNKYELPILSGMKITVQKEENGFLLKDIAVDQEKIDKEKEYSILLTDTTKSILKKINPKCAIEQIGDTTLSSAWIAAMSNGQQPSAPEDYIEVEK